MPDMLVKLYRLPDGSAAYAKLKEQGIKIMRPMTPNKTRVVEWVRENFGDGWADEISTAFTRFPVSCFIAYDENKKKILGFAGYDCTYKDFFGPTGVSVAPGRPAPNEKAAYRRVFGDPESYAVNPQ